VLGGEARDPLEREAGAAGERVADLERAGVVDADDVAREGLLDDGRSRAMNCVGVASRTSLPVRTLCTFMPRVSRPEQMRRKATRSRCAGSMFAWILKTNPLNSSCAGGTGP
jgi:hypothetical protein